MQGNDFVQSVIAYVMAIVKPSERTLASGVTNVTRTVAWAVGPSLAGVG